MSITINGTGSITGLTAGGLPDGSITSDDIASGAVTAAKLSTGAPSWTSGGVLSFNSGYGSVATAYGCRAWVIFNGAATVTINASGNVSSITDNGVGRYIVNFTTSMPDTSYAVISGCLSLVYDQTTAYESLSTNSVTIKVQDGAASTFIDSGSVSVAIFR